MLFLVLLGLYLSVRGYHSREGDQAYRLPLLLHRQNPALYADDPFVRAFDAFNPHRGFLALLDAVSRLVGLSAALAALYGAMYGLTCVGLNRLARAVWPQAGPGVGILLVGLVMWSRAGNIGTNHLFEPMLLDRGLAFALGWVALAAAIGRPETGRWLAPLALTAAALIHPTVGLQLAMLLGGSWIAWALAGARSAVPVRIAVQGILALAVALVPSVLLQWGQTARLFEGLSAQEFRLWSFSVQNPQHMMPHLWRLPQWLAWCGFFVLAGVALHRSKRAGTSPAWPAARVRLALALIVNLVGLFAAYVAIEGLHDLRVTVFQPFRMATIARGLALVAVAGRVLALWETDCPEGRLRAGLLAVGLTSDWALVVVTEAEGVLTLVGAVRLRMRGEVGFPLVGDRIARAAGLAVLTCGLFFLARHDPESGHVRLVGCLSALVAARVFRSFRQWCGFEKSFHPPRSPFTSRRLAWALAGSWAIPLAALATQASPLTETTFGHRWLVALAERCRFCEVPVDDVERLAVWCREHTPISARFIGPPGPKTFRLWAQRNLAFNRAASPYHAAGLADWSARFRDHVAFSGTMSEFARAYLVDRQGLEHRYQKLSPAQLALLARRQRAGYVIAAAPAHGTDAESGWPLELVHVEGRYAVYRLSSDPIESLVPSPASRPISRSPEPDNRSQTPGPRP